jgi:hypothetical protein
MSAAPFSPQPSSKSGALAASEAREPLAPAADSPCSSTRAPRGAAEQIALNMRLAEAAGSGDLRSIERALADGGDPLATVCGRTALMHAVIGRHADAARFLAPRSDANALDNDCRSALVLAVERDDAGTLAALLPHCDPDAREGSGHTALMLAVVWGRAACIDPLVAVSDLTATNGSGACAMDMAMVRSDMTFRAFCAAVARREREALSEAASAGQASESDGARGAPRRAPKAL